MELVGELYRRQHGRLAASLVRRLGPHRLDWAEELAQDALLRALETWPLSSLQISRLPHAPTCER